MTKYNPKAGTFPVLQYTPPALLKIDSNYQRDINNPASRILIGRIAKDWNWDLCQPLVTVRRDGGDLYVIDGQHRLMAAKERGDVDQLPVVIVNLPSAESEAQLFVSFNRNRRPLKPLDIWKAALAAGDAETTSINGILRKHGLSVWSSSNNKNMRAGAVTNIGGLTKIYREQGAEQFEATVAVIAAAFGHEGLQYSATLFNGVAAIIADECVATHPVEWRFGERAEQLATCLKARSQVRWYNGSMKAKLEGKAHTPLLAMRWFFRDAWARFQGMPTPAAPPIAPLAAKTIYVAPPAPKAPTPTPKPAPPPPPARLSFEEQLAKVESGEATVSVKPSMRGADPITHTGSSLA